MGDIAKKKLAITASYQIFMAVFSHFLSEILTKHNIMEKASKNNIWGPFYIPKGDSSGGS